MKFCLIFLVIVLVLVGICYEYDLLWNGKLYFMVVVDCGSIGIRVNVYEWGGNGGNGDLFMLLYLYFDNLVKSILLDNGC